MSENANPEQPQQPTTPPQGQQPAFGPGAGAPDRPAFPSPPPSSSSGQTPSGAAQASAGAVPPSGAPVPPGSPAGAPAAGPPYTRPAPPPGSPYATGYSAQQPASGAPYSGAPYSGGPYGAPASGAPYGTPVSGSPFGAPHSGPPATPGEAPGEPVASTMTPPGGYPHWTPPAATPKKMPTGLKVFVGGVAAVALALCSGVTGAVVATAFDQNNFSIPVSTNAAPVVDRSTLSGVAAKTLLSVVSIATGSGEGSGVILSEDGYILTNNHVVESARGGSVTVTMSDGKKVRGTVKGTDPRTDLAVVKAEATGLKPATFANSDQAAVGDTVLAIGSPLGLQGSVTSGILSAKDRTIRAGQTSNSLSGLLQTDAPINPGNSGGALVNTNGEVVGINTAIATSGTGEGNIGVGFAIPSNKAKQVAEQLIAGQKVSHAFLGVQVTPNDTGGAKIEQITPNSPAEAAGLQVGDIITKFGNRVVNDSDDLVSAVQAGTVGQKVTVEFSRNGSQQTATVTLGEAS